MSTSGGTSVPQTRQLAEDKGQVACPPHHWVIIDRHEDGYHEEHWKCRRCGDAKLVRTPTWAGTSRKMSNTSTWTPEDTILGGEEDVDAA